MLAHFSICLPRGVAKNGGRDDPGRDTGPFASGTATRLHPLVKTNQAQDSHDDHDGEGACCPRMSPNPLRHSIFMGIRNWRHDRERTRVSPFRKYALVPTVLL